MNEMKSKRVFLSSNNNPSLYCGLITLPPSSFESALLHLMTKEGEGE
jgi:hypothetical protein